MESKRAWCLVPFLSASILSGCGGDGDPLAAFKAQAPAWGSCADYFSRYPRHELSDEYVAKLGDRLQCADIDAPLDYGNPAGLKIKISAVRILAADAPEKKPHLFFNPGGPGGDGRNSPLDYALQLSQGNPNTPLGALYRKMSESFNFIGFSPRGVGASTSIVCTGSESVYPIDRSAGGDQPENIRRITESARFTAQNCQKNPVADFVNTDATARDMDLMREVLGDEKMHYYGISYGTWLGFWYAGLFPEHVGRMVMDSSMNFSRSIHQAATSTLVGMAQTYMQFTAPYAARNNAQLGMGDRVEDIVSRLNDLTPQAKQLLVELSFRAEPETIARSLLTTRLLMEASDEMRKGSDSKSMAENLHRIEISTGVPDVDEKKDEVADDIVAELLKRSDPDYWNSSGKFEMDNEESVFNTVMCNDEPLVEEDPAVWIRRGFELARTVPIVPNSVASQPCLYWHRKKLSTKPAMDRLKNANVLMVQSEYDVPTPLSGAMETFDQLPAASMVLVRNEGTHGLPIYQTECVDLTVMNYLMGQQPARRLTECEGKPLALDEQTRQAQAGKSASVQDPAAAHFVDPELARRLMARLRGAGAGAAR